MGTGEFLNAWGYADFAFYLVTVVLLPFGQNGVKIMIKYLRLHVYTEYAYNTAFHPPPPHFACI